MSSVTSVLTAFHVTDPYDKGMLAAEPTLDLSSNQSYNLAMNLHQLIAAVQSSNSKIECMNHMGLAHTNANFRLMNTLIRDHRIDTSHFVGIKATTYFREMHKPLDSSIHN